MSHVQKIWDEQVDFPSIETMPYVDTVSHIMIHRATRSVDQFLLGAAIAEHKGILYTSWVNSKIDENEHDSVMAGRRSADGGWHWSEKEMISPGFEGDGFHSHGTFFSHEGQLWAFTAQHGCDDHGDIYPGLKSEAFLLNEQTNQWESRGVIAGSELFWPLEEPKRLPNGNWIFGGAIVDDKCYPAVAVIDQHDVLNWTISQIPIPSDLKLWGETAVLVGAEELTAIIRYGAKQVALVSVSHDQGATWTQVAESNFPMTTSKPYAGVLSTGQRYLISNWPDRNTLTIALSEPGKTLFSHIYKIRHGASQQARNMDSRGWKATQWAYPYAIEWNDQLYIVYAVSKEDCELSIVPLACLQV